MVLPYNEEILNTTILNAENFYCAPNFIGYLNPNGQAIDYSRPFGMGDHDSNDITDTFKEYIYLKERNPEIYDEFYDEKEYLVSEKEDTLYKRNILKSYTNYRQGINQKYGRGNDPYGNLKEDILKFFYNCYCNDLFSQGFNANNTIMSEIEFYEKVFAPIAEARDRIYPRYPGELLEDYYYRIPSYYNFEIAYERYKDKRILEILKVVMVKYLGYHYVARTPRTIYTSCTNIYETFYNYFLNDFNIIGLPKMIYNKKTHQYEKLDFTMFHEVPLSGLEYRFREEIISLKRAMPREKRISYYRY